MPLPLLNLIRLVLPGRGGSVVVVGTFVPCSLELLPSLVLDLAAPVTMVTVLPSLPCFLSTLVTLFLSTLLLFAGFTSFSSSLTSSSSRSSPDLACETTLRPMFCAMGLVASSLMSR